MANEIGWGAPYDAESGWGMAAVNGAEIGYGTIVIDSYSGDTNMSSIDADNDSKVSTLSELPLLYMDGSSGYVYFLLGPGVVPQSMAVQIYLNSEFSSEIAILSDGIISLGDGPARGEYYVNVIITIDSENIYSFPSNTITV